MMSLREKTDRMVKSMTPVPLVPSAVIGICLVLQHATPRLARIRPEVGESPQRRTLFAKAAEDSRV